MLKSNELLSLKLPAFANSDSDDLLPDFSNEEAFDFSNDLSNDFANEESLDLSYEESLDLSNEESRDLSNEESRDVSNDLFTATLSVASSDAVSDASELLLRV